MSGSSDHPSPSNNSYFQHSFPQGRNKTAGASVILSHEPEPGSVTFIVPANDKHAEAELKGLGDVSNMLNNPATVYRQDDNHFALTTQTSHPTTTALFYTQHLEKTGLLPLGAARGLENTLAQANHLPGIGHNGTEAQSTAEPVVANLDLAQQKADHVRNTLQVDIAHTTTAALDPAREKVEVERQKPQGPGGPVLT